MSPSNACIDLVKMWEGKSLKAYPDPGTGGAPWTIGYGHTGPEVHPGQVITDEEAELLLANDLGRIADGVDRLVQVQLTQEQFDALVCFAFNVGLGNLSKSTLLKLVNQGRFYDAAHEFVRWDRAAGKEMAGLRNRRLAEEALFEEGTGDVV